MVLRWTYIAKGSLQRVVNFIEEKWGIKEANNFLNSLDGRLESITLNANLAPIYIEPDIRRLVIHKHSSLFFTIETDVIKILLVWDNRQNPARLLALLLKQIIP